jgi:hypothetical protein
LPAAIIKISLMPFLPLSLSQSRRRAGRKAAQKRAERLRGLAGISDGEASEACKISLRGDEDAEKRRAQYLRDNKQALQTYGNGFRGLDRSKGRSGRY